MKIFLIIAFVAVAATTFAYDLTDGPLRAEALELLQESGGIRSRIMAFPVEKKMAMLEYVRLQQSRDVAKDFNYEHVLLCLGDEATYQDLLKKKDFGSLEDTLDPHAFELIAPEMFRDDPWRSNGAGIPLFPYSVVAQGAIGTMLRQMPQVPPHIKAWMDSFINTDLSEKETQQIFRDWWTANEQTWRRRDFTALKAGPDMSHRNIPRMRAEQRAKQTGTETGAPGAPERSPVQPAPSPPVPSQKSESLGIPWLRLAVIGTLIFCVAFGLREWIAARSARK